MSVLFFCGPSQSQALDAVNCQLAEHFSILYYRLGASGQPTTYTKLNATNCYKFFVNRRRSLANIQTNNKKKHLFLSQVKNKLKPINTNTKYHASLFHFLSSLNLNET